MFFGVLRRFESCSVGVGSGFLGLVERFLARLVAFSFGRVELLLATLVIWS